LACLTDKLNQKSREIEAGVLALLQITAIKKVSTFLDKEELEITLESREPKSIREEVNSRG
jgi:hypothetical protein